MQLIRSTFFAAVFFALLGGFALTGCGGNSSETVIDPNEMTEEQVKENEAYIEEMDS